MVAMKDKCLMCGHDGTQAAFVKPCRSRRRSHKAGAGVVGVMVKRTTKLRDEHGLAGEVLVAGLAAQAPPWGACCFLLTLGALGSPEVRLEGAAMEPLTRELQEGTVDGNSDSAWSARRQAVVSVCGGARTLCGGTCW